MERQQAAENARVKNLNQPERLVDSLKKVGVENFHMKAAVPGTEIPEHKVYFSLFVNAISVCVCVD